MNNQININKILKQVKTLIKDGANANKLLKIIYLGNNFIPKETELWDYKENFEIDNTRSLLKLVKHISAFYNSYGGYIIFGVKEIKKDEVFVPTEFQTENIVLGQIKNYISNYITGKIDVTISDAQIKYNNNDYTIKCIYIPRRNHISSEVARVKKRGEYKNEEGKKVIIFDVEDVFFRYLDECKKVTKTEDWKFVLSTRDENNENRSNTHTLEYYLPDKQLICAKFIGRKETLYQLWDWLSEPMEFTKILVGEGGKGKTSIVYEFCKQLVDANSEFYDRIIWMTAKQKQFIPFSDVYTLDREVDFTTYDDFLDFLLDKWGIMTDEYQELSTKQKKKLLKESFPIFPSLIVVDDVDSLSPSDQEQLIDACTTMATNKVNFLITTRNRLSRSDDLCIRIKGLEIEEYKNLVQNYCEVNGLQQISIKNQKYLHEATDGSPLLTQSILRLIKLGTPFNQAVNEWKGKAGEDARNAVLKREIDLLSSEAKRVLVCITMFGSSCSYTELVSIGALPKNKLELVIRELNQLFIVDEPEFIKNEPRYSVSNTVRILVNNIKESLTRDTEDIRKDISKLRKGIDTKKTGNIQTAGLAIVQALALLKDGKEIEAIQTITTELKRQNNNNPDLLLAYGRILYEKSNPDYEESIKYLKQAFNNNQRKRLLFDIWYKCEDKLNNIIGRVEICRNIFKVSRKYNEEHLWNYRMGYSLILYSNVQYDKDRKIKLAIESSEYLSKAIKLTDDNEIKNNYKKLSFGIHKNILAFLQKQNSFSPLDQFMIVIKLIKDGNRSNFLLDRVNKIYSNENINYSIKKGTKTNASVILKMKKELDSLSINQI